VNIRLPFGTLLVGGLLLALLFWWSGRQGAESGAVIHAAHQALASGKAYRSRQAKLQAVAQRALNRAVVAIASDRAKDASLRELQTRLAGVATDSERVVALRQIVDTVSAQRDSARSALGYLLVRLVADSTRAFHAENRVAELERHLAAVLRVADCRILGISWAPRCPSRTVSAVVGATLGATAVLAARR
jgi:hypothetical protein